MKGARGVRVLGLSKGRGGVSRVRDVKKSIQKRRLTRDPLKWLNVLEEKETE